MVKMYYIKDCHGEEHAILADEISATSYSGGRTELNLYLNGEHLALFDRFEYYKTKTVDNG